MKKILLTSILLVLIGTATASFSVQNQNYDFNIDVAGQNHTENISVTWDGETSVVVSPEPSINADTTNSKGVNVSYSPDQFILNPGDSQRVEATIKTSPALIPDNFTVTHEIGTEIPVEVETVSSGGGTDTQIVTVEENVSTDDDAADDVTVITNGELNKSEEEELRKKLEKLNTSKSEQDEMIESLKDNLSQQKASNQDLQDRVDELQDTGLSYIQLLGSAIVAAMLYGIGNLLVRKYDVRGVINERIG